ncbi:MAG TPA: hypothetical protein VF865_05520 [Acidobacteriaceae bacterium]
MNRNQRTIVLLVVQAALVLSIAGKYLYERKTCPRVWVRTAQFDPNMPLRGRYLSLQLAVDACGLPRDEVHRMKGYMPGTDYWRWEDAKPVVRDGKLVAVSAGATDRPELTDEVILLGNRSCDRATLSKSVDYFTPDTAKGPFPLKKGEELWVEVTVPQMGPPRPIQLALAKDGAFTPLKME